MSARIRQFHRWMSLLFTAGVFVNFAALDARNPSPWIGALAAVPLAALWLTGMFLYVQPLVARRRARMTG